MYVLRFRINIWKKRTSIGPIFYLRNYGARVHILQIDLLRFRFKVWNKCTPVLTFRYWVISILRHLCHAFWRETKLQTIPYQITLPWSMKELKTFKKPEGTHVVLFKQDQSILWSLSARKMLIELSNAN